VSDSESFIARWSRRKRRVAQDEAPTDAAREAQAMTSAPDDAQATDDPIARDGHPESSAPAFDITSLPPIESITADSDIRAFLAPGVPPELTRAALRRVWTADPKIRDFVEMADYDWDFNTPGAITGFGPLQMPDELRRELMQMVGRSLDAGLGADHDAGADRSGPMVASAAVANAGLESSGESPAVAETAPIEQQQSNDGTSQDDLWGNKNRLYNSSAGLLPSQENIAPQYDPEKPDDVQLIEKRSHGRALPK
jgi:uncharacterized protein DUF3306